MYSCITTFSFAVIVNGGPSVFFKASRGRRQRDLLSLHLFIIVIEALNRLLERAKEFELSRGVVVGRGD